MLLKCEIDSNIRLLRTGINVSVNSLTSQSIKLKSKMEREEKERGILIHSFFKFLIRLQRTFAVITKRELEERS